MITINEFFDIYTESAFELSSDNDISDYLRAFDLNTQNFHKRDVLLYFNDSYDKTFELERDNLEEIISQIKWSLDDDISELRLELKCDKKIDNTFYVLSEDDFISSVENQSHSEQIKGWLSLYHNNYENISINGELISLKGYVPSSETYHVINYRSGDVSNLNDDDLYPCFINFLCEKLKDKSKAISSHLSKVRTVLCLALLAKKTNLLTNNATFTFENEVEITINEGNVNFLNDKSVVIFDIYKWAYNDEKYIAKVGILWQLLSKSFNTYNLFNEEVIHTLKSLYQIYLKDDFESYIDLRNKLSDSVIELTNKITESIQQSRSGVKQTLFITVSYFFSIFVFTAIDKGKLDNFLSLPVCILSTLFLVVAIAIVTYNHFELQNNIKFHNQVLHEVKSRHKILLSDDEMDSYFEAKSLKNAIATSKSITMVAFSIVVFLLMGSILWGFYATKTVFISTPVFYI